MEFRRNERGEDIGVYLPGVFADVVALPFDQVFEVVVAHAAVQDLLDNVLLFAVDQDRGWGWQRLGRGWGPGVCEFDYQEDRVESAKRKRQGYAIRAVADFCFDREGA